MKVEIKDLIKKSNMTNNKIYIIIYFTLCFILFVSSIVVIVKKFVDIGIVFMILTVIFGVLGVVTIARTGKVDFADLTMDVEKDLYNNLVYSDNILAFSSRYLIFFKLKKVFRLSNVLFIIPNNNVIRIFVKDEQNTVYAFNLKYSDPGIFNNVAHMLNNKCMGANILYRDDNLIFSTNAMYDINRICGKEVVLLRDVFEIIRNSNYNIIVSATVNGRRVNGSYNYNNVDLINRTFGYLANNCSSSNVYNSLEEYNDINR